MSRPRPIVVPRPPARRYADAVIYNYIHELAVSVEPPTGHPAGD
jgi:hypothetical protein